VIPSDKEISQVKLDLPNQNVIKIDVKRTRPEADDRLAFKNYLELLLTYYCKYMKISYKQGLNELFAPFLCLHQSSPSISLQGVMKMCMMFSEIFAGGFYIDEEFIALEHSFVVIQILLKYHDPELFFYLKKNEITPELYSTPWLLTLFASYLFFS